MSSTHDIFQTLVNLSNHGANFSYLYLKQPLQSLLLIYNACYTSEGEYYVIRPIYVIFSDWAEIFFLAVSCLPNNEMTNNLCVCDFVILSFCDSVILWPIQLCHHFYI